MRASPSLRVATLATLALMLSAACGGGVETEKLSDGGTTHSASSSSTPTVVTTSTPEPISTFSPTPTLTPTGPESSTQESFTSVPGSSSTPTETIGPPGKDWGRGDMGSMCDPPPGGPPCTPGVLTCGSATPTCSLSTDYCCRGQMAEACQPLADTCAPAASSTPEHCQEAADCPTGQVCCLAANSTTAGTLSCQALNAEDKCPSARVVSTQICRSSNECPSGSCQIWSCLGGSVTIESCTIPLAGLCMPMSGSSGGGSASAG